MHYEPNTYTDFLDDTLLLLEKTDYLNLLPETSQVIRLPTLLAFKLFNQKLSIFCQVLPDTSVMKYYKLNLKVPYVRDFIRHYFKRFHRKLSKHTNELVRQLNCFKPPCQSSPMNEESSEQRSVGRLIFLKSIFFPEVLT